MDTVFEPGQFTVYTAVFLVALGFAVGVLGTIVGAGGAFMLTPILLLLYPEESAKTVTAISLTAVFFNAGSGSIAYARQRRIDFASGLVFAAAAVPGAVAGALFVGSVPRRYFDLLVALMLCALGRLASRSRTRDAQTPIVSEGRHS